MERTGYEIALLEARQTLREYLAGFKAQNCIPLTKFRRTQEYLIGVEQKLRDHKMKSKISQLL